MADLAAEIATVRPRQIRKLDEISGGLSYFQTDDVLVAKITPCFENGKIAQVQMEDEYGFGSTEFHVVRARSGYVESRYLLHYLRQNRVRKQGERLMTGSAGQRRVPVHFLEELDIPLPPISEQRRIAAILDQVDFLRRKRRAALMKIRRVLEALFLKLFGHPAHINLGLPTISLGELGEWRSGGTPPRSKEEYFLGDVPWFSSGELEQMYISESLEMISEAALSETSAKRVPAGALLLGMYDTAALKASIAAVNCSCNQAVAFSLLNAKLAETVFVYFAITIGRDHFRRLQRGVRQKNLNLEMIRSIRIPRPPLAQQKAFCNFVQSILATETRQATSLEQLELLANSLQHRAFRGEL